MASHDTICAGTSFLCLNVNGVLGHWVLNRPFLSEWVSFFSSRYDRLGDGEVGEGFTTCRPHPLSQIPARYDFNEVCDGKNCKSHPLPAQPLDKNLGGLSFYKNPLVPVSSAFLLLHRWMRYSIGWGMLTSLLTSRLVGSGHRFET